MLIFLVEVLVALVSVSTFVGGPALALTVFQSSPGFGLTVALLGVILGPCIYFFARRWHAKALNHERLNDSIVHRESSLKQKVRMGIFKKRGTLTTLHICEVRWLSDMMGACVYNRYYGSFSKTKLDDWIQKEKKRGKYDQYILKSTQVIRLPFCKEYSYWDDGNNANIKIVG